MFMIIPLTIKEKVKIDNNLVLKIKKYKILKSLGTKVKKINLNDSYIS